MGVYSGANHESQISNSNSNWNTKWRCCCWETNLGTSFEYCVEERILTEWTFLGGVLKCELPNNQFGLQPFSLCDDAPQKVFPWWQVGFLEEWAADFHDRIFEFRISRQPSWSFETNAQIQNGNAQGIEVVFDWCAVSHDIVQEISVVQNALLIWLRRQWVGVLLGSASSRTAQSKQNTTLLLLIAPPIPWWLLYQCPSSNKLSSITIPQQWLTWVIDVVCIPDLPMWTWSVLSLLCGLFPFVWVAYYNFTAWDFSVHWRIAN